MKAELLLFASVPMLGLAWISPAWARPPLTDSTDVRISDVVEAETSVFVSPLDPNTILVFNNYNLHVSTDGGRTWPYSHGGFGSDPAAVIVADSVYGSFGRFVGIANPGFAHYKNQPASGWTSVSLTQGEIFEKPHLTVDNSSATLVVPRHRLYAAWMGKDNKIELATSANGGVTWPERFTMNHLPGSDPVNFGVNLQTGRTGRVYVIWSKHLNHTRNPALASRTLSSRNHSRFRFNLRQAFSAVGYTDSTLPRHPTCGRHPRWQWTGATLHSTACSWFGPTTRQGTQARMWC